jgi:hypothetical protein
MLNYLKISRDIELKKQLSSIACSVSSIKDSLKKFDSTMQFLVTYLMSLKK